MSGHPRKIAYYITPHGFGHAVRSLEIIRCLLRESSDVEITLVSDIPEFLVIQNIGRPLPYRRRRLDFGLVQLDSIRFDLASTLSALMDLQARADQMVDEESEFLRSRHIGLVVADIPFLPFRAARRCGIPSLGVGNFTWDWIYSNYADQDRQWTELVQWIAAGYSQCDLLLRLPMHGDCSACPRHVDVPLVARHSNRTPEETRGLLGLAPLQPAYLLAFATLDLDDSALRAVETIPDAVLLFKHPLDYRLSNGLCLDPFDLSYPDVIAASDAVITKPGYGIVSDCLAHGTPMIYTDRGDFPEYPILVDAMKEHLPVAYLSSQELYSGRWDHAMAEIRRHARRPVNLGTDGADVCARIILESLGGL